MSLLLLLILACVLVGCGDQPKNFLNRQQMFFDSQEGATDLQKLVPAQVIRVVDGDTVRVSMDGGEEIVRLIGVNAPEIAHQGLGIKEEPYGKKAFDYTREHLDGRQIFVELDVGKRDKYGRLLAYVWLERPKNDGEAEVRSKMYNAELVLNGYAQVMTVPPNVKYLDLFVKFQREAREQAKGLWGPAGEKENSAPVYVGNTRSKKFHYPDCQWAQEINPKNRVDFKTREEAIEAGYEPCKTCRP